MITFLQLQNKPPKRCFFTKKITFFPISGDDCALSLHSTCIHKLSVGGGTCPLAPPQILLASLWGAHAPQNFYRIHNDLKSLFKKNKQFLQNLFKIFLKFSKISNILYKLCKIFLIFFQQIILNSYFYYNLLKLKKLYILNCHNDYTIMYYFSHCKHSVLYLTKNWWIFKSIFV